ncbi:MAG: TetR/AcrR family transcriptional regulator [Treponemataceae bacterium]|nr:TetR/AcrR family transcriptional regulator [Treponemataceae bacterium]
MLSRERIIETAFKVWGEECYRTRSLTAVAKALGVSKAALYRHFRDKDELIEALYKDFYTRFIPLMEDLWSLFQSCFSPKERFVTFGLHLARYFIRQGTDFGFLFFVVMSGQKEGWSIPEQLRRRGLTFEDFFPLSGAEKEMLPYRFALIFSTVGFYCGVYYLKQWYAIKRGEELFLEFMERVLRRGLGLVQECPERALVSTRLVDIPCEQEAPISPGDSLAEYFDRFAALCAQFELSQGCPPSGTEGQQETVSSGGEIRRGAHQTLIAAIAAAVAERGPWEASMSYVAERSGLSKSGLYAHFASKETMLEALFKNEYEALLAFLREYLKRRNIAGEQNHAMSLEIGERVILERVSSSARVVQEGAQSSTERSLLVARLWLVVDALYSYLSAHRDLLVILDWVRIQRIDIGKLPEKGKALWDLMGPFPRLTEKIPVGPYNTHRWILFSLISVLMMQFRQPSGGPERKSIQKLLFTYLAAGVEGWYA